MLRKINIQFVNKILGRISGEPALLARLYNTKPEENADFTHFGYETVETKEKTKKGKFQKKKKILSLIIFQIC